MCVYVHIVRMSYGVFANYIVYESTRTHFWNVEQALKNIAFLCRRATQRPLARAARISHPASRCCYSLYRPGCLYMIWISYFPIWKTNCRHLHLYTTSHTTTLWIYCFQYIKSDGTRLCKVLSNVAHPFFSTSLVSFFFLCLSPFHLLLVFFSLVHLSSFLSCFTRKLCHPFQTFLLQLQIGCTRCGGVATARFIVHGWCDIAVEFLIFLWSTSAKNGTYFYITRKWISKLNLR